MLQNQHIRIHEMVFVSSLSKGAKLLYGTLESLPVYVDDPRQQELELTLPPPVVKMVAYAPADIAAYMQCGVASIRRYVKELIAAGWLCFHEGKARYKVPLTPEDTAALIDALEEINPPVNDMGMSKLLHAYVNAKWKAKEPGIHERANKLGILYVRLRIQRGQLKRYEHLYAQGFVG